MSNAITTYQYNKPLNIYKSDFMDNFPIGYSMFWGGAKAPNKSIIAVGQTLNRETYKELYNFAAENDLIVSEADWHNTKLQGFYSDGDGSTTFRLPCFRKYKIIGFDSAANTLGKAIPAALPNIRGEIAVGYGPRGLQGGGAFYVSDTICNMHQNGGTNQSRTTLFSASKHHSLYRDGVNTVQTPDIPQNVIIKYKM